MLLQMSLVILAEKRETSPPIFVFRMTPLCSSSKRPSPCFQHVPTTVGVLRQPGQIIHIHTSREAYTFRRRFRIPQVFSWSFSPCWRHSRSGVIICDKYRVWFHTTVYHIQYSRWCTQHIVCGMHRYTRTTVLCVHTVVQQSVLLDDCFFI